tara:strand:- start:3778 stop:4413 length:636 start_codon:yes stop_codon:yes gene_type:complete
MDLKALRREYLRDGLERENLEDDPFDQFELWMAEFLELDLPDPAAMTIATVAPDGQPSQRIVLLKHFDQSGFFFYSNYDSRKAQDLDANPMISLHFPWHVIERQVKICGVAEKISAAESWEYFSSRPRGSQIAAAASPQSRVIDSRAAVLREYEKLEQRYKDDKLPLPDNWGGYRVVPNEFEFWQGGAHRLHDRFRYSLQESGWSVDRLAP